MQKLFENTSFTFVVLLLVIFMAGQGCVSKRHAKRAQKLENEGLYEMAVDNYLRSFNANPNNIDAITGLRRAGQRTLDSKAAKVNQACLAGNDRETVYQYLNAEAFYQRIRNTGVNLVMHEQTRTCYEEAKTRYLDRSFEEARLLLEEERFGRAESIFSEIKTLDPSYNDLSQYMKISQSEPLYRQGVDLLNSGFYRQAYNTFSLLMNNHGPYKDASELREDALAAGMLTIAIAGFENRTRQRNAHDIIKTRIIDEIGNLNNPFILIVDDRNTEAFLKEQERAASMGNEMKIGRLMAAKAMLTGSLQDFELRQGRVQRTEKRGYLREEIEEKDEATGEKTSRTIYHKVSWNEFRRENYAYGSFRYQLSSTETGAVLASGVVQLKPTDQVHYAIFDGDHSNLVPGHWEHRTRESPKDNILDRRILVRNLQNLFSARNTIKTTAQLHNELIEGIAREVSNAIDNYNPER